MIQVIMEFESNDEIALAFISWWEYFGKDVWQEHLYLIEGLSTDCPSDTYIEVTND